MKKFYIESELVFTEKSTHGLFRDLEGEEIGRLSVIGFAGIENKRTNWFCRCFCGSIIKVCAGDLKSGNTSSCGCLKVESIIERSIKHGHSVGGVVSSTYGIWRAMLRRCNTPKDHAYPDYGGRGIKVCERWEKFDNFLEDMGERPKGMSIDRMNNNLGYYKENCRWATRVEQQNSTRRNHVLVFDGKTQTIAQWANELGINRNTLLNRISRDGWSVEKTLTTPVRKY